MKGVSPLVLPLGGGGGGGGGGCMGLLSECLILWLSLTKWPFSSLSHHKTGGSVTSNDNGVSITAPGGTDIRTNNAYNTVNIKAPVVRTSGSNSGN